MPFGVLVNLCKQPATILRGVGGAGAQGDHRLLMAFGNNKGGVSCILHRDAHGMAACCRCGCRVSLQGRVRNMRR